MTDNVEAIAEPNLAAMLREPFPAPQIGKLPRVTCRNCRDAPSRVCSDHSKTECSECGNYMTTRHIHLDYVGHAAVTDRLLQVDPSWTWEPAAIAADGGPLIRTSDGMATMWIRLTVGGVTRLGCGSAQSTKADVEKELIGDALRNAAMRFGVALDLWSKEDLLAAEDDAAPKPPTQRDQGPPADPEGQPTSAGNVRRGPRVEEGWEDADDQKMGHDLFIAAAAELSDEQKAAMTAFKEANDLTGWPLPKLKLAQLTVEMERVLSEPF